LGSTGYGQYCRFNSYDGTMDMARGPYGHRQYAFEEVGPMPTEKTSLALEQGWHVGQVGLPTIGLTTTNLHAPMYCHAM